MAFDVTAIRVMISSPSDVMAHRSAAAEAVHRWNDDNAERRKVVFLPWMWELSAVPVLGNAPQSILDEQGVDQSDLVVAFFGSRIGSPSANGVSGTVEEIERALAQGKRVHLYFSTSDLPRNVDGDQLAQLRDFRGAAEKMGLLGEFSDEAGLQRHLRRALDEFAENINGERSKSYYERNVVDRVYEEIQINWSYHLGGLEEYWDATTTQVRHLRVRSVRGLSTFSISMARQSDSYPTFGWVAAPAFSLDPSSERSSVGSIELLESRKSGTSYEREIAFHPPLSDGDLANLKYQGSFKGYKFATREQIVTASATTKLGLRNWDDDSITIQHPTAVLNYSVFLADDLGAVVLGPQVDRDGIVDQDRTTELVRDGYSLERTVRDGRDGQLMTITVREPTVRWTYRLKWRAPSMDARS